MGSRERRDTIPSRYIQTYLQFKELPDSPCYCTPLNPHPYPNALPHDKPASNPSGPRSYNSTFTPHLLSLYNSSLQSQHPHTTTPQNYSSTQTRQRPRPASQLQTAFIFNPPGRPKGGPILPTKGRLNRRRVGEGPLESFRGF